MTASPTPSSPPPLTLVEKVAALLCAYEYAGPWDERPAEIQRAYRKLAADAIRVVVEAAVKECAEVPMSDEYQASPADVEAAAKAINPSAWHPQRAETGEVMVERRYATRFAKDAALALHSRGWRDAAEARHQNEYHERELADARAERDAARAEVEAMRKERDDAVRSHEHCVGWYAERFERLRTWAKALPADKCTEYFSIVANGSPSPYAPSQHSIIALRTHERNDARKDRDALAARVKEAEAKLSADLTHPNLNDHDGWVTRRTFNAWVANAQAAEARAARLAAALAELVRLKDIKERLESWRLSPVDTEQERDDLWKHYECFKDMAWSDARQALAADTAEKEARDAH